MPQRTTGSSSSPAIRVLHCTATWTSFKPCPVSLLVARMSMSITLFGAGVTFCTEGAADTSCRCTPPYTPVPAGLQTSQCILLCLLTLTL